MKTYLAILMISMSACHSTKQAPMPSVGAMQQLLVYKTRSDYSNNVPVIMNEAKTAIVSYPDPRDLKNASGLLKPVPLKEGYFLDRKGINNQVAFLTMSYEAYSSLVKAPTMNELEKMILDKDPLVELCNCGNAASYPDPERQLNKLIGKGKLHASCKKIK